jgi:hypothetical protein
MLIFTIIIKKLKAFINIATQIICENMAAIFAKKFYDVSLLEIKIQTVYRI